MDNNDVIQVAEKLYREKNPESKMDVPSFAYEFVEKWAKEWFFANSELSLYEWIKQNKELK